MANQPSSTDVTANKAVVCRFVDEVTNQGNTQLLTDLVAGDYVGHFLEGDLYGPEGVRIEIDELRTAFTDVTVVLEHLVATKDRVMRRFVLRATHAGWFLGIPATGCQVAISGLALDRLAGGKLVENWIQLDIVGLLRQLGGGLQRPEEDGG